MDVETEIHCDLAVIGAGMAGMAASLFAANRGIDTVQIGIASQIISGTTISAGSGVRTRAATCSSWAAPARHPARWPSI